MINEELPAPNIPLLRKAVEWAEAEAAKTDGTGMWNQENYVTETKCGSAYCIAGHVVAALPGFSGGNGIWATIDGSEIEWGAAAIGELSITDDEADDLFFFANSIERVREVAERIAARAGERL